MSAIKKNPQLWTRIKNEVLRQNIGGTLAGQWSARKAQIAVKRYKDAGGTQVGPKSSKNSLVRWTSQRWTTASGRPSHITGERYLPAKAFSALTKSELREINRSKREAMREGHQFSKMPISIANKVRNFRK